MQLFLITRTTINKGNSRGKIPLPLNLNKVSYKIERCRMSAVAAAVGGGARAGQVFLIKYFVAL